jgi:hypothetical protein
MRMDEMTMRIMYSDLTACYISFLGITVISLRGILLMGTCRALGRRVLWLSKVLGKALAKHGYMLCQLISDRAK